MARRSSRTDPLWSHLRDNCLRNVVVSYDTLVSLLGLRRTRWNCFTSMCYGMKMDKEFFECGSGGIMHGVHSTNFGSCMLKVDPAATSSYQMIGQQTFSSWRVLGNFLATQQPKKGVQYLSYRIHVVVYLPHLPYMDHMGFTSDT